MNIRDAVSMAIDSIKERKLRISLNTLGILIGIAALTALMSITQGMNQAVNRQMELLSPTAIIVTTGGRGITGGPGVGTTLRLRDVDRIERIPRVTLATPVISGTVRIEIGGHVGYVTLAGIVPDEFIRIVRNIKVEKGRILVRSDSMSVVLGASIACPPQLGKDIAHVGSRITIAARVEGEEKRATLRVVGILSEVGGGFVSPDDQIYVPLKMARQLFNMGNRINQIFLDVESTEVVDEVVEEIQEMFGEGITVFSMKFIKETVGNILGILDAVLGGVAAISLVVAGISIVNTMTISVMERTREIGIMKAVGAKNRDVLMMFLIESSLTGFIGGIAGAVFGVFLSYVVSAAISIAWGIALTPAPSIDVGVIGVCFAVVTGVISGLYPAHKASKLDPVEALRYE